MRLHVLACTALLGGTLLVSGCAGGGGLNLIPEDQIQQMGLQAWTQLRQETPASTNSEYNERAKRVVGRVLTGAGMNPAEWELVVFRSNEINAFALPGNKIGIYEGMMKTASSDAELAAVIGHEIAHNTENHAGERANSEAASQIGIQVAAQALGMGGGVSPDVAAALLGAGAQYGLILPYGRRQELEADKVGLIYMAKGGYDPQAAIAFWRKMAQASGGQGQPTFMSTHPNDEQRIAQIEKMMPEAMAAYQAARK